MLTIIESPLFTKLWPDYWTEDEHGEFMQYLANDPGSGSVIPGSGGCRKVRWSVEGQGKRGAVRVIYIAQSTHGALMALLIYGKTANENIPTHILRKIAKEMTSCP
ncbi:transcriptional regulator [Pseudomonas sp. microsymbiont 2]